MKKVTRWESEDGQVFRTEKECINHEKQVEARKDLTALASDSFYDTFIQEEVADWILQQQGKIFNILKELEI